MLASMIFAHWSNTEADLIGVIETKAEFKLKIDITELIGKKQQHSWRSTRRSAFLVRFPQVAKKKRTF
jgi:hypothetical protein